MHSVAGGEGSVMLGAATEEEHREQVAEAFRDFVTKLEDMLGESHDGFVSLSASDKALAFVITGCVLVGEYQLRINRVVYGRAQMEVAVALCFRLGDDHP